MNGTTEKDETQTGSFLKKANYTIAVFFALLGLSVLLGYPVALEGILRWVLGGVLELWAVYRWIATKTKFPIR